jgi:hypothetical protein
VRLTPHFTRVHDLYPGILSIVFHSLLISWFTQVGNVHSEEANNCTSLGDRSQNSPPECLELTPLDFVGLCLVDDR